MIKAKLKPIDEICEMIGGRKRILVAGCAGCTAICLAGGQREVDGLCAQLNKEIPGTGITGVTVERQCDMEYLQYLDRYGSNSDIIVSMACGAGVQFCAERFPGLPVVPALNTHFAGVNLDIGLYEEKCRMCGDCQLGWTGGICPFVSCAKGLLNGPCGGSSEGLCEVGDDVPCGWAAIYERLKDQGRLEEIYVLRESRKWKGSVRRVLVQKGFEKRYIK